VIFSVLISPEFSSKVVVGLVIWVLEIVFSVRRCLPDIDHSTWDSLSSQQISDLAVHQSRVSARRRILDDAATEFAERSIR
jgi:hypothetical protein